MKWRKKNRITKETWNCRLNEHSTLCAIWLHKCQEMCSMRANFRLIFHYIMWFRACGVANATSLHFFTIQAWNYTKIKQKSWPHYCSITVLHASFCSSANRFLCARVEIGVFFSHFDHRATRHTLCRSQWKPMNLIHYFFAQLFFHAVLSQPPSPVQLAYYAVSTHRKSK